MTPEALKKLQYQHMSENFKDTQSMNYESAEAHDFFRKIPYVRVKKLLDSCEVDLTGKHVLISSCGSGIDIHYLRKFYKARFFATDLVENAVATAKASFPDVEGQVEDGEKLSFQDGQFDYSFVAASLHHLPRPVLGLYELLRVSKKGVIVIEPNDSWLTRVATAMGLATEVEPSGNYVYRISKHDVARISKSLFSRYHVDRFFASHRIAKNAMEFTILKVLNFLANWICSSQGNYIVFIIHKNNPS